MLILTTESSLNIEILEVKGLVVGSTVQCKHIGKDIGAGLKSIVGGEQVALKEMLDDARKIAMDRMIEDATKLGANAIIGFKISSSSISQGSAEIVAYGTAVMIKEN